MSSQNVARSVVGSAIGGTILLGGGAAVLSYAALMDLARAAGTPAGLAFVWPIIVDGVIVVATVAIVALRSADRSVRTYAWCLLAAAAAVSVVANGAHALVTARTSTPAWVAVGVSAVPPLVLLAITHLTVLLARRTAPTTASAPTRELIEVPESAPPPVPTPVAPHTPNTSNRSVRGVEVLEVLERAVEQPAVPVSGDLASLEAWVRDREDAGLRVTATAVVDAGLAGSPTTARRRLAAVRGSTRAQVAMA